MRTVHRVLVQAFLNEARSIIELRGVEYGFSFRRRPENMATLRGLGWTVTQLVELILTLTVDSYSGNVDPTDTIPEDGWVFGVQEANMDIYIKLAIVRPPEGDVVVCVSFHESRWKLSYPYNSGCET